MKMNLKIIILYFFCITNVHLKIRVDDAVEKHDTFHCKKNTNDKCVLNKTITNDFEILSSAVSESKYIFTARVLRVRIKRYKKQVKVFMTPKLCKRLIIEDDLNDLRSYIFLGDEWAFNGAIVLVDWLQTNKCAYKLNRHSLGFSLSYGFYEGLAGGTRPLLLNDPLSLSLYDLDRVNAALRNKCLPSYNLSPRTTVHL